MDWNIAIGIGGVLALILGSILTWQSARQSSAITRQASEITAENQLIDQLQEEVARLRIRMDLIESKNSMLWQHVQELRDHIYRRKPPPPPPMPIGLS